ncbi:MAG: hypothetical protein WBD22_15645 [Pyrinomonadaceae bacterium]
MNLRETLLTASVAVLLHICLPNPAAAQTDNRNIQSGPDVEIVLQLLTGDEANPKGNLPKELAPVAAKLRSNFPFASFRLIETFFGRIGENGNLQYKSIFDVNSGASPGAPTFLDWSINALRPEGTLPAYRIHSFRFGIRTPIVLPNVSNYEHVGITIDRLSVSANTPVLLGSISLPKANGTVFVVLTVKPEKF